MSNAKQAIQREASEPDAKTICLMHLTSSYPTHRNPTLRNRILHRTMLSVHCNHSRLVVKIWSLKLPEKLAYIWEIWFEIMIWPIEKLSESQMQSQDLNLRTPVALFSH